ncbi:MAG: hypothetical protein IR158_01230 [Cellulomonas sp.]|uniref:hypothetical protein n=1 Tax=Cellulomonas sp. TaxID=40001 RepID=UPI0019E1B724|nr:hypothetical protein [Cellulomonas sp.]MBF0686376.1 hypothetical protein [Cellulomonas sp.]
MATIVDRRGQGRPRRATAHHARDPGWVRPPQHTRSGGTTARHGTARRGHVVRDVALALLTTAAAVGVVAGLLHDDPAAQASVLELLHGAEATVRAWLADLPRPGL